MFNLFRQICERSLYACKHFPAFFVSSAAIISLCVSVSVHLHHLCIIDSFRFKAKSTLSSFSVQAMGSGYALSEKVAQPKPDIFTFTVSTRVQAHHMIELHIWRLRSYVDRYEQILNTFSYVIFVSQLTCEHNKSIKPTSPLCPNNVLRKYELGSSYCNPRNTQKLVRSR